MFAERLAFKCISLPFDPGDLVPYSVVNLQG